MAHNRHTDGAVRLWQGSVAPPAADKQQLRTEFLRSVNEHSTAFDELQGDVLSCYGQLRATRPEMPVSIDWHTLATLRDTSAEAKKLADGVEEWARRWRLSPDHFEGPGHRAPLASDWVLTTALRTLRAWHEMPGLKGHRYISSAGNAYWSYISEEERSVAFTGTWQPLHETKTQAKQRLRREFEERMSAQVDAIERLALERGATRAGPVQRELTRDMRRLVLCHVCGQSLEEVSDNEQAFPDAMRRQLDRLAFRLGLVKRHLTSN